MREHPMRSVNASRSNHRRTEILTEAEQGALLKACPKEARPARSSGVDHGRRVGELLALKWEDVSGAELVFWETKNGRSRRLPVVPR